MLSANNPYSRRNWLNVNNHGGGDYSSGMQYTPLNNDVGIYEPSGGGGMNIPSPRSMLPSLNNAAPAVDNSGQPPPGGNNLRAPQGLQRYFNTLTPSSGLSWDEWVGQNKGRFRGNPLTGRLFAKMAYRHNQQRAPFTQPPPTQQTPPIITNNPVPPQLPQGSTGTMPSLGGYHPAPRQPLIGGIGQSYLQQSRLFGPRAPDKPKGLFR